MATTLTTNTIQVISIMANNLCAAAQRGQCLCEYTPQSTGGLCGTCTLAGVTGRWDRCHQAWLVVAAHHYVPRAEAALQAAAYADRACGR